jgi:hypothetical protein
VKVSQLSLRSEKFDDDDDDDDYDGNDYNNNNNNNNNVKAKHSSNYPVSNIIYGGNTKVTTAKSKKI